MSISGFIALYRGDDIKHVLRVSVHEKGRWLVSVPKWMLPAIDEMSEFPAEQIAKQLGALCRYAGATPEHYSVARHSLVVAALAPDDPPHKMAALLHDAHEALTGDILRPMTRRLSFPSRSEISRIQHAIDRQLYSLIGFDPCPIILGAVSDADDTACRLEMQLLGKTASEITDALPNLREAAWQLAFHGNAQIDATHWLVSFSETLKVLEAMR